MQQQEMEFPLEKVLAEGEGLLWSGRPSHRALSAGPNVAFIVLTFVFGVLGVTSLITAILLSYSGTVNATTTLAFYIIGGIFLFLAILFGIFAIVFRQPLVQRQTIYAITNQRVIILRTGTTLTVESYTRNDIGHITRRERPDGSGDLIFAGVHVLYGYNSNSSGYSTSGTGSMFGAGSFTGIPNVRGTEHLLRSTFKVER